MAKAIDWERFNRAKGHVSSPAPTQAQIDFILALTHQKGVTPRKPRTMARASEYIDHLLGLPDVNEPKFVKNGRFVGEPGQKIEVTDTYRQDLAKDIRERFPCLSPMSVSSLLQLQAQIDEVGMAFFWEALDPEDAPDDRDELILYVLKRFLEDFAPVNSDDLARG